MLTRNLPRAWRRLGLGLLVGAFALATQPALADGEDDPPPPSDDDGANDPPEDESQPGSNSGLSDTETNYTGAIMLRGGQEVTFDTVVPGYVGDESYQADGRYAYFTGNTLYAGVQDNENNYVDMIAEFFWFESSLDRGSDFYVAVVKARTSPNLQDWVLEHQGDSFLGYFLPDDEATLYLRAQTEVAQGNGGFRWDWSIPFDSYGWDAYGNTTMETKYGLSVNAEGSAQKAFDTNVEGVPVEANVQAKGYFNSSYQVQTKYEVTLWRWEVVVHGSAGQIDWQMNLHSHDREKQNAYHEYFIVMQADQGVPFKLDWLEVGGSVREPIPFWFDNHRSLSAGVTGIVLRPPQLPPPPPSDEGESDGNGTAPPSEPPSGGEQPRDPGTPGSPDVNHNNSYYGCSASPVRDANGRWAWLAALALGGLTCRRWRMS